MAAVFTSTSTGVPLASLRAVQARTDFSDETPFAATQHLLQM